MSNRATTPEGGAPAAAVTSGGGFLGCFCRPKHLEDTGVYTASSTTNGTTASRSIPTVTGTERPRTGAATSTLPPRNSSGSSNRQNGTKHIIRKSHNGDVHRDSSLIPSPPSDDATPLISNRKVGSGGGGGGGGSGSSSSTNILSLPTSHSSSSSSSSQALPPSSKPKPKKSMNIKEGTKIVLIKAEKHPSTTTGNHQEHHQMQSSASPWSTEHPVRPNDDDDTETEASNATTPPEASSSSSRKSVSYYPNHVQDNVKVMRDYYEQQAFISSAGTSSGSRNNSYEDMTESTVEDITESSSAMDDLLAISNSNQPTLLRVDCQNDPYESAYAVWYRQGLLKWRPKSVPHSERPTSQEEDSSAFGFDLPKNDETNTSIVDLVIVPAASSQQPIQKYATELSPNINVENKVENDIIHNHNQNDLSTATMTSNEKDDITTSRSVLEKYRSSTTKTKTVSCQNCQKDMSSLKTIQMIKCTHCQQELYCSVFCRGNDRYTHSMACPAQPPSSSSSSVQSPAVAMSTTTTTTMNTTATMTPKQSRRYDTHENGSSWSNTAVDVLDENSTSRSNSYKKSRQVPMVSLFGVTHHLSTSGSTNSGMNSQKTSSTTNMDTTLSARRLTTEFRV